MCLRQDHILLPVMMEATEPEATRRWRQCNTMTMRGASLSAGGSTLTPLGGGGGN